MRTWYEQAVFYHIYPLGLTGAPKENHVNEPAGRFEELNKWVGHMKDLNCTALYIGPIFESSTHGYDTRDFRLIDRRLGSNDDFKHFVEECHKNGIRVVVDGVFNHTGREFFAFRDIQEKREASPYKDWYRGINFGWGSPLGDSFSYEAWQGHFELPCLNLWNPQVKEYLFDTINDWIKQFDIDGIRLDCANVLDFNFMKELRSRTASMKEDFWLMGEVIHGEYSRWVNAEMLHSVTNYELHKALYSGHNDHNYFEIAHNVRRLAAIADALYTFVDNHDEDRIASKLVNKKQLEPVYQLLFTLPGIPSIYYGSEWAMEGKRSSTSDEVLRPAVSMEQEPSLNCKLTEHIQRLAEIHLENEALHGGRYEELLLTNRQYAFCRHGQGSLILSAVNNDENPAQITIPVPSNATKATELFSKTEVPLENGKLSVTLPPTGGAIYRIMEG